MVFGSVSRFNRRLRLTALVLVFLAPPLLAADANVYYRYLNKQGVRVLDDSIPPEYAQKGYEVVSLTGEVIKVVPPAPDADDLARKQAMAKLREEYERLSRRYSSLNDIEAAKQRKLDNIETNIALVRGNVSGVEAQIGNLMSQAANIERAGRQVPESLLQKLADTRAELTTANELLQTRLEEYDQTAARFEEDKATYSRGKELVQTGRLQPAAVEGRKN